MPKLTIRDFLNLKGKKQIMMTFVTDHHMAKAAELAGFDLLGTSETYLPAIRRSAPNTLIATAFPHRQSFISDEEAIRCAFKAMEAGADIVAPGVGPERVAAMVKQGIPVHGHVGLVPFKATWIGGLRAVGKTAQEALQVYRDAVAFAEAGVVVIEIECVPDKVAAEIAKRVDVPVISMGCGSGCDGQYLFAIDILGAHDGHYPRHAKIYRNFFKESVAAFGEFIEDVNTGAFPTRDKLIDIKDEEFERFVEGLESS